MHRKRNQVGGPRDGRKRNRELVEEEEVLKLPVLMDTHL